MPFSKIYTFFRKKKETLLIFRDRVFGLSHTDQEVDNVWIFKYQLTGPVRLFVNFWVNNYIYKVFILVAQSQCSLFLLGLYSKFIGPNQTNGFFFQHTKHDTLYFSYIWMIVDIFPFFSIQIGFYAQDVFIYSTDLIVRELENNTM